MVRQLITVHLSITRAAPVDNEGISVGFMGLFLPDMRSRYVWSLEPMTVNVVYVRSGAAS